MKGPKLNQRQLAFLKALVVREGHRIQEAPLGSSVGEVANSLDSLSALREIEAWIHAVDKWNTYE